VTGDPPPGGDPNRSGPSQWGPEASPPDPPGPGTDALRRVRSRLRVGTILSGVGMVGLLVLTDLPLLQVLAIPVFYLLLPALAVAQLPLLDDERLDRIPVYIGSIVTILGLGFLSVVLMRGLDGVAPAGLTALPSGELLAWTLGLTAAGLLVVFAFRPVERVVGGGRSELLRDLLPRTRKERGLFAALSFSAGVGEELAFRAYAFQAVQLLGVGPWGAAVLSSIPFGFLHAYQGPIGVLRTAIMGFILAVPVVMTGSLLPSMAAHTLIDLLVGLVLGPHLLGQESGGDLVPPPGEG